MFCVKINRLLIESVAFLSFALVSVGCSVKPYSRGIDGEIVIIADEADRPVIRKTLENTFGRIIATPQPEHLFSIVWDDWEGLEHRTRSPLILIASSLDGDNPTTAKVNSMLSTDVKKGVLNDSFAVFQRHEPWARDQLMMLLVGKDKYRLGENAITWADSLYNWVTEFAYDRLADKVSKTAEAVTIHTGLNDLAFSFKKPPDYIETQRNDSLGFVRYIRHYPERWIMVRWGNFEPDSSFDANYVYYKRSECNDVFLDPVDTYVEHWTWRYEILDGSDAIKINGLWGAEGPHGGGPYFTYGIVFPEDRYYILVDGAVLAPGESKIPYIWQLEAIAHTIEIETGD